MPKSFERTGIWKFSGPLRVVAFLLAALYMIYYAIIWGVAMMGDTELVFDLMNIVSDAPLTPLQIAVGMMCSGVAIGAVVIIVFILNRLLRRTYKDGFFKEGVAETIRHLGWALILFWLGLYLTDGIMPWLLTKNLDPTLQVEAEWIPLDDGLIALFVGFVLLLVSDAVAQAREIDEDNRQFI